MSRGPTNDPTGQPERQRTTVADELAREIKRRRLEAGFSQRALAARAGYSRQYVSITEWEDATLPSQELVAALDTALSANGALIALRAQAKTDQQTRRRNRTNEVDRADEPRASLTANVFSPFNLEVAPANYVPETRLASSVVWSDVDAVREAARRAATTGNLHGGGSATTTADQELHRFAPLLRGQIAPATQRALFEAIGNLSGVAAFAAFDIADFTAAEQHARFALWCADAAGSWELRASTLADMARMTAYTNSSDDALSLIELAQVRSDRLSATTRAMLGALRAQFLATLGRTDEALHEVACSDEHFADRTSGEDAPWMCYYDEAEHMGSTGKALIPVALARKQIDLAAPRIGQAIRRQGQNYPRSRTFSLTRLATLTMRIGDPREAAAIGSQAANRAKDFDSQRIRDELRTLARVSVKHLCIPEVDELYSTLTTDSDEVLP
ncbi:helix-turn-helix transcriptional regulator [Nocardia sp. BMG51109]|uniref:helix-turn-helix domain-containing protein n=1 Tax=Nocardia sp. BMG51109 TaxID=1056816 RepID=UPI0018DD46AD|nr:helix-turn-helix transcriptional regulator [Nocardia sp. BMG51109]